MTEQVDATAVDGVLRLDRFDDEIQEGGAVAGRLPAATIDRVRTGDDEAFFRGETTKEIDERPAIPTESGTKR